MDLHLLNSVINIFSLGFFAILCLAIFGRLSHRVFLYREANEQLPILLIRDIILFAAFSAYIIIVLVIRGLQVSGLADNTLWLLFSSTLFIVPLAFWAWVEYRQ